MKLKIVNKQVIFAGHDLTEEKVYEITREIHGDLYVIDDSGDPLLIYYSEWNLGGEIIL